MSWHMFIDDMSNVLSYTHITYRIKQFSRQTHRFLKQKRNHSCPWITSSFFIFKNDSKQRYLLALTWLINSIDQSNCISKSPMIKLWISMHDMTWTSTSILAVYCFIALHAIVFLNMIQWENDINIDCVVVDIELRQLSTMCHSFNVKKNTLYTIIHWIWRENVYVVDHLLLLLLYR
jgi:hypothetical protein